MMTPTAFAAPRLLAASRSAFRPSSKHHATSSRPRSAMRYAPALLLSVAAALLALLARSRPLTAPTTLSSSANRSVNKSAPPPSAADLPGTPYVTAMVTAPDAAAADRVADAVISARVAACVNMVPGVTSVYWWEGKVVRDTELLLVMKTRASLVPKLTALVNATHPFEVPEVIVQPIVAGLRSYLDWIGESTAPAAAELPE